MYGRKGSTADGSDAGGGADGDAQEMLKRRGSVGFPCRNLSK